jgi:hypothetical protein
MLCQTGKIGEVKGAIMMLVAKKIKENRSNTDIIRSFYIPA